MLRNKKISSIEELKIFLKEYLKGKNVKVYLFGSRAKGDYDEYSDIDIAVEGDIDIASLRFILEESNLPQKVDVVDMKYISDKFKEEILKHGIRWI